MDCCSTTRRSDSPAAGAGRRGKEGYPQRHPYFEGIDFARLPFTTPPYTPPFSPLPVICDDVRIEEEGEAQELENELNALRGSIDVTYRQQQEERKEGGGGGAV